jgi:hypothetical protein
LNIELKKVEVNVFTKNGKETILETFAERLKEDVI